MKKHIIILISLSILFAIGVVLFSFYQTNKIQKEMEIEEVMPQVIEGRKILTEPPSQLTPVRPQDYGMIVIDDSNKPQAQEEWDILLSEKIKELKSQTPSESWRKVKEQIKEDPQKTQEKLKQIDENIKKCKQILRDNPDNQEIKDKLERLMILKSIAKELP